MADKLRVFVSWSGERSRLVARALSRWLRDPLQSIDCWMSEVDIGAGTQWNRELWAQLDRTDFGVLCLTPENLDSRWMLFEAGYLAKSITGARIVPYVFGMKTTDVPYPLAQFQSAPADSEGTLLLVSTLNRASAAPLDEERMKRVFGKWWHELESQLASIQPPTIEQERPAEARSDKALLEELLGLVRGLSNRDGMQAPIHQAASETTARIQPEAPLWRLKVPDRDGTFSEIEMSVPWRSLTGSQQLSTLSQDELQSLSDDELTRYGEILRIAFNNTDHTGYEAHMSALLQEVGAEWARRRKPN